MFELPIACGGRRARGKAGSVQARGRDAGEGQWDGLPAVARAGKCCRDGQPCLACSPAAACALWQRSVLVEAEPDPYFLVAG